MFKEKNIENRKLRNLQKQNFDIVKILFQSISREKS